jgi:catalase-peroxidase
VLGVTFGGSPHGVLTDRVGALTTDFFVNLLDMGLEWRPLAGARGVYEGVRRGTGERRFTATRVDLMFGASAELRAIAEVYASADGHEAFVRDFVAAWRKVMDADRFDLG